MNHIAANVTSVLFPIHHWVTRYTTPQLLTLMCAVDVLLARGCCCWQTMHGFSSTHSQTTFNLPLLSANTTITTNRYSAWKTTIDTMHYKILDAYAAHITKHALVAHGACSIFF